MNARAPIAHGGPQCLPARRSVAREGTARRTRVPSVDSVDDPYCLTGIIGFMQLVLVSTAQIAATLTPTQSAAWLRDHDHRNR